MGRRRDLGWWGPDGTHRLVVATVDPTALPDKATWYLVTDLPRPGGPCEADGTHPAADLTEIVRIYGIRHWIEQSYKQIKDELGWADFQVRSDVAIHRHQVLVDCAFGFCWATWFTDHPPEQDDTAAQQDDTAPQPGAGRGERGAVCISPTSRPRLSACIWPLVLWTRPAGAPDGRHGGKEL